VWIYLLKKKSDVFQVFHNYQHLVERQFGTKILALQSDWGGEYEKLNSFFQKVGIEHHVSCPHTHQQNGSAERKHRHIVEVGLALLANASMPLKFWDEAFLTATHLINMLPSKTIDNDTPMERLLKKKPDYAFLRVFGCAYWPNLWPYNQHKLAYRSKQCVFLGYSHMHKGVKCLDVTSGRVYISRDVVFDETVFPFSKLHPNAGSRLRQEILLLPEYLQNPSTLINKRDNNCNDLLATDSTPPVSLDSLQFYQCAGENSAQNSTETREIGAETRLLSRVTSDDTSDEADHTSDEADSPRIGRTSDSRGESAASGLHAPRLAATQPRHATSPSPSFPSAGSDSGHDTRRDHVARDQARDQRDPENASSPHTSTDEQT
jgi:hypothetical protein